MHVRISECSENEFERVKIFIKKFELDNRALQHTQFLTLYANGQLAGFGRVREYQGFSELCTLGILEEYRNRTFGHKLLKALEQKATQKIYLVTVIPHYFKKLGYTTCLDYPTEIADKLRYCIDGLPVEETYVVMSKKA